MTETDNKNIESLKIFVKNGDYLEHDIEICGHCFYTYTMAQVAKEMLEKGDTIGQDVIGRMVEEHRIRWNNSKFVKLWIDEIKEGRDPRETFGKRGWTP